MRRLFREILDDSVRRQHDALQPPTASDRELRVAYQGTEGAYGHQAACQHFGVSSRAVALKAYPTFRQMLEAVVDGHADRGVLPIENTTAGSVYEAYDLLLRYNLALVGEEIVDIRHCLVGVADVPLETLRQIHSHPQALAQCSEFLSSLPACEATSAANTALAAGRVRELNDPAQAAIASEEAAAHFGLHVLRRGIANQPVNYTRFVIVSAERRSTAIRGSPRRCRWCSRPRHEHGALARSLNVIADEGISMTKLESRPRREARGNTCSTSTSKATWASRACRPRWPAWPRGPVSSRCWAATRPGRSQRPSYNRSLMERTFAIIKPDAVKKGVCGPDSGPDRSGRVSRVAPCG